MLIEIRDSDNNTIFHCNNIAYITYSRADYYITVHLKNDVAARLKFNSKEEFNKNLKFLISQLGKS